MILLEEQPFNKKRNYLYLKSGPLIFLFKSKSRKVPVPSFFKVPFPIVGC